MGEHTRLEVVAQTLGAQAAGLEREKRFFALVNAHQDRAVRVAWRLIGGDDAAAEDVAQDAFYKSYRGLDRFRDDASLATWFYRILVNEARKYRRWRAVRDRWHTVWTDDDTANPAAAVVPDPLLQRRLADALSHLPRGQHEAFVLVHLEGFTVEQTADQLGKAVGTVKSHLHRALRALRTELGDLHDIARKEMRGTTQ